MFNIALLDQANTTAYGNPEITEVNIGVVGYENAVHIADRSEKGAKDFSALIEKAKTCPKTP